MKNNEKEFIDPEKMFEKVCVKFPTLYYFNN